MSILLKGFNQLRCQEETDKRYIEEDKHNFL
jgi:hypothetical protein